MFVDLNVVDCNFKIVVGRDGVVVVVVVDVFGKVLVDNLVVVFVDVRVFFDY